jgi:hypothetical protein
MVTYCAFAGNKCKKRIKRSKESFFMELNFKSNVRIVLSFIRLKTTILNLKLQRCLLRSSLLEDMPLHGQCAPIQDGIVM